MLTSTFLHTPSIGPATEKRLWEAGASDWQTFLQMYDDLDFPPHQLELLRSVIEESIERYEEKDYRYFAKKLVSREHWRAFGELGENAVYVDIETTGTSADSSITVIGLYDGVNVQSFVRGFNLEEFADAVEDYPLLVTFAGSSFDLPYLRRAFPGTKLDQLHLDLCPALRRLGYKGGLKSIEKQFGINREDGLTGLNGWDAVRLWWEWDNDGCQESLDTLVAYNQADIVSLKNLAEFTYKNLRELCIKVPPDSE